MLPVFFTIRPTNLTKSPVHLTNTKPNSFLRGRVFENALVFANNLKKGAFARFFVNSCQTNVPNFTKFSVNACEKNFSQFRWVFQQKQPKAAVGKMLTKMTPLKTAQNSTKSIYQSETFFSKNHYLNISSWTHCIRNNHCLNLPVFIKLGSFAKGRLCTVNCWKAIVCTK